MSTISKESSRSSLSSSSGISSIINDRFPPTLTLQTVLNIQRTDINARTIFCGEQDYRLNELRRLTGAIIDLNVIQGTRRAFERVNWTISHHQVEVRDFVVRRLNYWTKQTQIACDMAHDDAVFLREQEEKTRTQKPPLSSATFTRRNRTRSLTQSDTAHLYGRRDSVPRTPSGLSSKRATPFTGLLGRTLFNLDAQLMTPAAHHFHRAEQMTLYQIEELLEAAKWANVLSDTSDDEIRENRVSFADNVSLSKFSAMLRNNELNSTSDLRDIERVLEQSTMNVTHRQQSRQMNGKYYWFHRIVLDNHIQFPPGISEDGSEARHVAYRHMIDVCLHEGGVELKLLTNNRVKVVKGSKHRNIKSRV